jgi:hypothetical protein
VNTVLYHTAQHLMPHTHSLTGICTVEISLYIYIHMRKEEERNRRVHLKRSEQ